MSTYPTSSRRAARPWLALGLVGLLALTGCSDDDSDSTTTTSAAPSTQDATTESVDVGAEGAAADAAGTTHVEHGMIHECTLT